MEMIAEQENTAPKVGDLVVPPVSTTGFSKYGTIKSVGDGTVTVSFGGPSPVTYPIEKLQNPSLFQTDDPVWKGMSGKVTLWRASK